MGCLLQPLGKALTQFAPHNVTCYVQQLANYTKLHTYMLPHMELQLRTLQHSLHNLC